MPQKASQTQPLCIKLKKKANVKGHEKSFLANAITQTYYVELETIVGKKKETEEMSK